MKKINIFFLAITIAMTAMCQSARLQTRFNFDFEEVADSTPVGWSSFGQGAYRLSADSNVVESGKYAALIAFEQGEPGYRAWMFTIPGSYPGKTIKLSGYIKTEAVDGFAGLWMRIDPRVAFNNMQQEGIKGTTDWKRYEFTLPMNPEKTEQIVLGGLLVGTGKAWFDSLSVTIDGKDIATLEPMEITKLPAQLDTTFDNGSTISLPVLDEPQSENLKVLGLVWGFLKYYHPRIAAGEANWDYELFRVLPDLLEAKVNTQRDEVLVNWINKFGPIERGTPTDYSGAEIKLQPDLDWITTSGFSDPLETLLFDIRQAKRTGRNFYVSMYPGVGNPDFGNENPYAQMRVDDDGFRLLALYRYWNMVQYFFPYKHLLDEDWKNVLTEFVQKFTSSEDRQTYVLAVLELIGRVRDTHANIWGNNPVLNNFFGERHAPVELLFIENQPVVSGYRHDEWGKATGLKVGDMITRVNGESVKDIIQEMLKYTPASNYPTQLRDIAPKLLRTNDSTIRVEALTAHGTQSFVLNTYDPELLQIDNRFVSSDTAFRMLTEDIAYLNNGTLNADSLGMFWEQIKNTKGLIIDNRNYPNRPGANKVGEFLMPDKRPFARFSFVNIKEPGIITMGATMDTGVDNPGYYKGKVIILVNEVTQSSAEFHAMSYRVHPNAIVVGSTTAGADGDISPIVLPGGIRTAFSGIGVYYPDGRETQRVGIVPDIEVKPTIEGIKSGRDEVLEKAVGIIKEN